MPNEGKKKSLFKNVVGIMGAGTATLFFANMGRRFSDRIPIEDSFSQHTQQQHRAHLLSGMHEPYIPSKNQLATFRKYFADFGHLLPVNPEEFRREQALKTPVRFRSLNECPRISNENKIDTLVVGGFPALLGGITALQQGRSVVYINDDRRRPIAYGSAWHLEQDAETEAPTTYQPIQFFNNQVRRATFNYVSHASVQNSGIFPWRTLDWFGWLSHPAQWFIGLKIAHDFQRATTLDSEQRNALLNKVAQQCKANEKFFEALNQKLNGKLLMPSSGSLIVARTPEEVAELNALRDGLIKEGRTLKILSKEEVEKQYGFAPQGLMFAEKTHDRVLSPHFNGMLTNYIRSEGGQSLNGTLTSVYIDEQQAGGIAEYRTPDGQSNFIPFSQLILSLGSQQIFDKNDKPLFDVVAARGVSALAYVYVQKGIKLPPVIVCGGTNHVTKLSEEPITIQEDKNKHYDLYLVRVTAGACITPNVSDETAANYDGTIAVGLISAMRKTLGEYIKIDPISVYGCNRQVSKYGQTHWFNPYPGINIQYGAGGGGLTRGPDFAVAQSNQQINLTPRNRP